MRPICSVSYAVSITKQKKKIKYYFLKEIFPLFCYFLDPPTVSGFKQILKKYDDGCFDVATRRYGIIRRDFTSGRTKQIMLKQIQTDNKQTHGNHRPPYIRERKIISPRIIISSLFGNEAHVDAGDKGKSAVVWVAENPDDPVDDWHFILQTLRTHEHGKVRDTITVQLFHGIVIIYDGRAVRHATSLPHPDSSNKWGVFHGSA